MTKPPSAAEIASDYVRGLVFGGTLRSGDKVPVEEIAELIGVSRQPIREALIELASDGLVLIDGRKGTFVADFGPHTVRDHYELYGLLESFAVRRVTELGDADLIDQLRALTAVVGATTDTLERRERIIDVLRVLNRATGNTRLRQVLRTIARFTPGDFYLTQVPGAVDQTLADLERIIDAIAAGDADGAAARTSEVWAAAGHALVAHLRARGVFDPPSEPPTH